MLKILGKDRTIAKSTTIIDTYDAVEGLSSWVFVNPSDDEQNDHNSSSDDQELLKQEHPFDLKHFDDEKMCKNPCSFGPESLAQITGTQFVDIFEAGDAEDDDDDLDDELVPIWLSDKFGRQRIRKLGERVSSRMNKSKRVPNYYNRPGCISGKHGLGVQHSYI